MGKQKETFFGERVDRDLRKAFGTDVKIFNIQQVSIRHTPDRLICIKGDFLAIELKEELGITEAGQIKTLLDVKNAGGTAVIVYPYTWLEILRSLKDKYATGPS